MRGHSEENLEKYFFLTELKKTGFLQNWRVTMPYKFL